jgi:hypothetical protein
MVKLNPIIWLYICGTVVLYNLHINMLICSAIQNNRCVLQPQHLTIISQVVHIFHKNHIWAYTISIFSKTYMYAAHMEICNLSYKRSLVMYLTQQININDLWNQTNFNLSFTHEPTINVLSGTSSGLHSTSTSHLITLFGLDNNLFNSC